MILCFSVDLWTWNSSQASPGTSGLQDSILPLEELTNSQCRDNALQLWDYEEGSEQSGNLWWWGWCFHLPQHLEMCNASIWSVMPNLKLAYWIQFKQWNSQASYVVIMTTTPEASHILCYGCSNFGYYKRSNLYYYERSNLYYYVHQNRHFYMRSNVHYYARSNGGWFHYSVLA
jgi:hypothetical protein